MQLMVCMQAPYMIALDHPAACRNVLPMCCAVQAAQMTLLVLMASCWTLQWQAGMMTILQDACIVTDYS